MRTIAIATATAGAATLVAVRSAESQTVPDLYPALGTLVHTDADVYNDQFGTSVATFGTTIVVGVPYDWTSASLNHQGSLRVFERNGLNWTLRATLYAAFPELSDELGSSVAIDGDTIVAGAPGNGGFAEVFVRNGTSWSLQKTLAPTASDVGLDFGQSVAISGETIVVGYPGHTVSSMANRGSARVFVRSGSTWTLQQTLTASDGAASDGFGASVAIDGDTIVVGVPLDDVSGKVDQGSARVFKRTGSTWAAQQTLTASDGLTLHKFGTSVDIEDDTIVVGVPFDQLGVGSGRIFVRNGSTWTAQQTLMAADGSFGDNLGHAVAIDRDTVLAGAPNDYLPGGAGRGTVRVFRRIGTTWTPEAMLMKGEGTGGFGSALAMSEDTIAIGSPYDTVTSFSQGAVHLFGRYLIYNTTRSLGFQSLAAAVMGSYAGDRFISRARPFEEAAGIIDASQKRFTFVALEPLTLAEPALMSIATGTVFEKSPDVAAGGLTVAGKLVAPVAGTVTFEQLSVANEGQFMQRGSSVLVNQGLATTSGGACYLEGSILAEGVSTAVGGQNRVAADTNVFGDYTNAGVTIVQRGILYIYGTLTNTGTMTGDIDNGLLPPAAGDGYSIGGDYVVGADASLVLPDPVWWLRVGGNLDIAIDDPSRFVMDRATIEMTGLGPAGSQTLEALSDNLGATATGFAASNFPIGNLRLRSGATVELVDEHSNVPRKAAETLYVRSLVVPTGATLVTNGLRIYTQSATIGGTVSNPADVVIVPDSVPCLADIHVDGVVNGADLGIVLAGWGACGAHCPADLNGDARVDAVDLGVVLAGWGPCPD